MSRSNKYTITREIPEIYSDFLINFDKNPVTSNLAKITNEDEIKSSIRNIIETRLGERFYNPLFGSKVANALFELTSELTSTLLKSTCEQAIKNNESRATVKDVEVQLLEDSNACSITIFFEAINKPGILQNVVIVKRIR